MDTERMKGQNEGKGNRKTNKSKKNKGIKENVRNESKKT